VAGQVQGFAVVLGSKGNDILVGGGQPVTLRGGTGRNILIAEAGKARLFGGGGDSILVAGLTLYDANQAALDKIMMEWKRNIAPSDRVHHITLGGGLNGAFRLFKGINGTVGSNGQVNDLTDGGGTTWLFLKKAVDKHHNGQSSDIITAL
jgi:Ca2+-binding RTX toxin-like protein